MNFDVEVLERSKEIPVVVDFWAPWCGPCQSLGPIIESLAEEASGQWELIKLNTDEHPELMQRFGIRSIPTVKFFTDGREEDQFAGLMPKHELQNWLEKNIPDPRISELKEIGNDLTRLESFAASHPDLADAQVALTKALLFSDPKRSLEITRNIKAGIKFFADVETYKQLARFLTFEDESDQEVAKKIKAGREAALAQDHQAALEFLISSIMIEKSYADELARLTAISYFHFLGGDHEVTKSLRRKFDMALY
ncbi:MAG: thioredoxin [Cyclobacteriaceae bacterium]